MDTIEKIINMTIDMTIEDESDDDIFVILNEKDKEYAVQNNLKIAYSEIDLEDSSYQETLACTPARKNRLCPQGINCISRKDCNFLHSLHDLTLFTCRDQHLCHNAVYDRNGYFINVGEGCFNVHGNEKRKDFFIRNGLVNQRPTFVEPIKVERNGYYKRSDEEKGIMFRQRRFTVRPDEKVIKTLVCQSIKKKLKCKFGDEKCTFAHTYRELRETQCKSRICSKYRGDEPCPYVHSDETRHQFALRNNFHQYFPDEVQLPLEIEAPLPAQTPLPHVQPPLPAQPPLPREAPLHFQPPLPREGFVQVNSRLKTKLCGNMGNCRYGSRCNFAHSLQELRK